MNIPALTAMGGTAKIDSKSILEYRVWVHPKKGGDDYYYRSTSYKRILEIAKQVKDEGYVEKPLGVVRDKTSEHDYREVRLKK